VTAFGESGTRTYAGSKDPKIVQEVETFHVFEIDLQPPTLNIMMIDWLVSDRSNVKIDSDVQKSSRMQ
jgi:hypothetical protein